jgi:hypothetical protein
MSTVNVAALVVNLLADDSINVRTRLRQDETLPVVRVEEAGGSENTSLGPNRLTLQDLQVDSWGESKADAWAAIATVRDVLLDAPRSQPSRPEGVLVRVSASAPTWLPDEDWPDPEGRPGPRYLMIVRVTAHQ